VGAEGWFDLTGNHNLSTNDKIHMRQLRPGRVWDPTNSFFGEFSDGPLRSFLYEASQFLTVVLKPLEDRSSHERSQFTESLTGQ